MAWDIHLGVQGICFLSYQSLTNIQFPSSLCKSFAICVDVNAAFVVFTRLRKVNWILARVFGTPLSTRRRTAGVDLSYGGLAQPGLLLL